MWIYDIHTRFKYVFEYIWIWMYTLLFKNISIFLKMLTIIFKDHVARTSGNRNSSIFIHLRRSGGTGEIVLALTGSHFEILRKLIVAWYLKRLNSICPDIKRHTYMCMEERCTESWRATNPVLCPIWILRHMKMRRTFRRVANSTHFSSPDADLSNYRSNPTFRARTQWRPWWNAYQKLEEFQLHQLYV